MKHFPAYEQHRRAIEAMRLPDSIPELLREAESKFADAEAVSFFEDGRHLTFRQLAVDVRRLADGLSQLGVRSGSHVAVMLSNCIEFPLTWLALAELGAVVTPVITGYSSRELAFLIDDADISHIVIEATLLPVLEAIESKAGLAPGQVIVVGAQACGGLHRSFDELLRRGSPDFDAGHRPAPDDLLSIQYTSGTTGLPKGVMLTHRFWIQTGLAPVLVWRSLELRSVLSDHPFYYIDPQWMLVMSLYTGGRIDFCKRMSVRQFVDWMIERRSDLAWLPDPLLKSPPGPRDQEMPAKLLMAYGFSPAMLAEAESRYRVPVREAYGMTEIGMGLLVPADIEDDAIIGTCGLPGPWREFRIANDEGGNAPDGQPGELWVRGEGVCRGYYKRPQANEATFVDGWFRTGDLFVRDERGYYRIVGRIKDMIKRSGENISAAEVEQVLLELPDVVEAAVLPVPDADRDEEVKAYLVLREGVAIRDLPPQAVLSHCASRLARFKRPRYLAYVDALPRTPSDKVAKHQLVAGEADLRLGAYDALDAVWR
ncbi:MAG: acyl--CoA ligase [Zoogloea sp.]|nr:acyl--CoA ligase [Zoogloea sp.]